MLIDSHCHLSFKDYPESEIEGVLIRAAENDVSFMINIGAGEGYECNLAAVELAHRYPQVFATVGIHPHDAKIVLMSGSPDVPMSKTSRYPDIQTSGLPDIQTVADEGIIQKIETLAQDEKVVAIGEIGLDFHYEHSPRDVQEKVFAQFLELAKRVGKPAMIHDRDAGERTYKILRDHLQSLIPPPLMGGGEGEGDPEATLSPTLSPRGRGENVGVVIHCFTGTKELARKYLDLGCLISFSGIVTFKKAADLHEVVKFVPIERMLVETDSPFLAPEPHRGKRNEPAYVKLVAEQVARLKGLNYEDVARITTLNAKRFFSLPLPELVTSVVYSIRDSLYLNITNRCTLACTFCPKFIDFEVKGYYLRLPKEPTVGEVLNLVKNQLGTWFDKLTMSGISEPDTLSLSKGEKEKIRYKEVVFCGYGEPTRRLDALKEIAGNLKKKYPALKIRLNTDGLGNLVHQRNILPELSPFVDSISISLNAADAKTYAKYCPSKFGEAAYPAVKDFIREATRHIKDVTATAVGLPDINPESCRRIAAELGAQFRFREYNNVG